MAHDHYALCNLCFKLFGFGFLGFFVVVFSSLAFGAITTSDSHFRGLLGGDERSLCCVLLYLSIY